VLGDKSWPLADTATAQGIGGAGPPQVAIGRGAGPQAMRCGGTPGKPGFLRSKKCARIFLIFIIRIRILALLTSFGSVGYTIFNLYEGVNCALRKKAQITKNCHTQTQKKAQKKPA
jgi:hypothetical protein